MNTLNKTTSILAAMALLFAAGASHAGIGKTLIHGVAIGAGAAVGHRAANAAMNEVSDPKDAKAKSAEKKKREQAAANQQVEPATAPVPNAPAAPAK